jgi:hypothetical protein
MLALLVMGSIRLVFGDITIVWLSPSKKSTTLLNDNFSTEGERPRMRWTKTEDKLIRWRVVAGQREC